MGARAFRHGAGVPHRAARGGREGRDDDARVDRRAGPYRARREPGRLRHGADRVRARLHEFPTPGYDPSDSRERRSRPGRCGADDGACRARAAPTRHAVGGSRAAGGSGARGARCRWRAPAAVPSALQVLEGRVGDCNEHAVLFVALARAAGLPARTVVGLVPVDGRFYYHAWAEVYLGDWVAVDPMLDEFPAGAAHVRFGVGGLARQAELVRLIGRVKLEVL